MQTWRGTGILVIFCDNWRTPIPHVFICDVQLASAFFSL